MTSRKLGLKPPSWVRWSLYALIFIGALGTAITFVWKGASAAEPYIPATRQSVRTEHSWNVGEHAGLRGKMADEKKRQALSLRIQMATLKAVDEDAAEELQKTIELERAPVP